MKNSHQNGIQMVSKLKKISRIMDSRVGMIFSFEKSNQKPFQFQKEKT